jgi:nucleotide-binding universal stress UspA family protein
MLDKVLYAVDFGEFQPLALPCLARLKEAGCHELVLAHVISEKRSLGELPDLLRDDVARYLRESVEQRMHQWADRCRDEGLIVQQLVATANMPWIELCDIASREEASLIVLGPTARRDPGPTSYFVMHAAATKLLILKVTDPPANEVYGHDCRNLFARVLLPTDWSECALRAEQLVIEFKSAGTKEVILAHAMNVGLSADRREAYRAHVGRRLAHSRRLLEDAGLEVRSLLLDGEPTTAILDAADRENASLIVMGSTGKSVTEEQRLGSLSERVALTSVRSVLLVH